MKKEVTRRITLRRITCSGAFLGIAITRDKWSEPVVDSVLLPSHATTSITSTRTVRFNSPGAASFTVPAGVTSIDLTVAGAGTNGAPGENGIMNLGTLSSAPTEGEFSGGNGGTGGGLNIFTRNGGNGGDGACGEGGMGSSSISISPGSDGQTGFVVIAY